MTIAASIQISPGLRCSDATRCNSPWVIKTSTPKSDAAIPNYCSPPTDSLKKSLFNNKIRTGIIACIRVVLVAVVVSTPKYMKVLKQPTLVSDSQKSSGKCALITGHCRIALGNQKGSKIKKASPQRKNAISRGSAMSATPLAAT